MLAGIVALAGAGARASCFGMFIVTESDAAAIRAAFHEEGELSAIIELRQRFPGVDHAKARACARIIAGLAAAACDAVPSGAAAPWKGPLATN